VDIHVQDDPVDWNVINVLVGTNTTLPLAVFVDSISSIACPVSVPSWSTATVFLVNTPLVSGLSVTVILIPVTVAPAYDVVCIFASLLVLSAAAGYIDCITDATFVCNVVSVPMPVTSNENTIVSLAISVSA
jgi:hypothetical protein